MTLALLVFLPKKAIGTHYLLPLHHRTTTDSTQVPDFPLEICLNNFAVQKLCICNLSSFDRAQIQMFHDFPCNHQRILLF